ncbi:MAG: hypothetical protein MZW92_42215 [Comamonadaceae bacterium]|nr:hypothetical protein [Comamonadaceae bacterium]
MACGEASPRWWSGPRASSRGSRPACSLLDFAELHRDEERLDDLLPWAGNVRAAGAEPPHTGTV